jgi:hypothetical protein
MPVSMLCFGYGSDHNAAILRDIASATETGSYYYVKDDRDVGSAFGDAMGGILSVVAQKRGLDGPGSTGRSGSRDQESPRQACNSKRKWDLHRQYR